VPVYCLGVRSFRLPLLLGLIDAWAVPLFVWALVDESVASEVLGYLLPKRLR
jgi:hypothetical protein